jgi:cytochrome b pre-mRNA-processing protein 3
MFRLFLRSDPEREIGRSLFMHLAKQARLPVFYERFAAADTIDGRFDILALHGFVVMEALKGCGKDGERIGSHLATAIFESLEEALRELGSGDIGISRRIKAMADAFYGRLAVYSFAKSKSDMKDALIRNIYRGEAGHESDARLLARYAFESLENLRTSSARSELLKGSLVFAPLPIT